MNQEIRLSASKLATFQKCSFSYYAKYCLKLPDKTNYGSLMGSLCHSIFECLLKPRHKDLFDSVMSQPATVSNCAVINKYILKYMKANELPSKLFDKIDSFRVKMGKHPPVFCPPLSPIKHLGAEFFFFNETP